MALLIVDVRVKRAARAALHQESKASKGSLFITDATVLAESSFKHVEIWLYTL